MMSQSYDDLDLRKYRRVLDNEMLRSVDDTVLYCSKNIDLKSKLNFKFSCIMIRNQVFICFILVRV